MAKINRLTLTDFRTTVDDAAVTLDYGPGSVRLYGPDVNPAFDTTWRAMPGKLAAAGARKLSDGPAMRVTVPKAPDAGKVRRLDLAELKAYAEPDTDSCLAQVGKTVAAYAIVRTDGHAAVFHKGSGPGDPFRLAGGPDRPIRAVLSADFWRAYARVRTCRHERTGAIRVRLAPDHVRLAAGDVDTSGFEACETVTLAGDTDFAPFETIVADPYLWPLRGAPLAWHQGDGMSPIWFGGIDPLAVVVMPMRA